jgi:hypothetical protein
MPTAGFDDSGLEQFAEAILDQLALKASPPS